MQLTVRWLIVSFFLFLQLSLSYFKLSSHPSLIIKAFQTNNPNMKHFFIFKLLFLSSVSMLLAEFVLFTEKSPFYLVTSWAFAFFQTMLILKEEYVRNEALFCENQSELSEFCCCLFILLFLVCNFFLLDCCVFNG